MTERLPIYDLEADLVAELKERPRLVLSAPTGSGKSTQVPPMLLRHGFLEKGEAVVLQPRRIAARLLAARVAEELGVPLGREIGYQARFEGAVSPATRIRYVTEGILLRRMIDEPELPGVAAIVFDEFHERHLYGDVTLARALDLQQKRPDLRILVMSATLDLELLERYLDPCARLSSEGRVFPIRIEHDPGIGEAPVWDRAAGAFARWASEGGEGDVLIFMPGAYEIARTIEAVGARPEARGRLFLPLHGELSPRDQDEAVARHGRPKVVVSTNVAETSLTIDGVRLVIDSGLARIPRYDPGRGINTLLVEKISRASADQRAGRAGRTAPGTCIRLWPERETRPARELPEVKRLDLSEVVLSLKAAGVVDLQAFRWLEPPDPKALSHAEELLGDLGAVQGGGITPLGRRMLAFPTHPRYARMLLAAQEYGCVREAALAAALTQGRDLLLRRVDGGTKDFREERFGGRVESDFEHLIRAWTWAAARDFRMEDCVRAGLHAVTARQVGPLFDQFLRIAQKEGLDVRPREKSGEALRKCLLIAFPDLVARRLDGGTLRCELTRGRRGTLARESEVRGSPLLVAAEAREVGGKDGKVDTILSLAAAIEPAWLGELFPGDVSKRLHVAYDSGARRVTAEEQVLFRDLPIESRRADPPPAEEAARLLAAEVLAGRLRLEGWDAAAEQWIFRVNLLARACPELGIAAIDEAERRAIAEEVCRGAVSYKEIKDRPVLPVVRGRLDPARQALVEKHAPERIDLPGGRRAKVTYAAEAPPWLGARIQDLYGMRRVPAIALGRVALLVHVLAPNQRPVQVTQDLEGFWRDHYPRVKKELQRKYPKHEWREAP
jgi:ATP-dependent helicase HrpB